MDFTALLDVVIGLSLVYLGAALFVTIVNEYVAQLLKLRAKQVAKDLRTLIDDHNVKNALKANPALAPFFDKFGSSYVDAKVLAHQLVGGLRTTATTVASMNDLVASIAALPDSKLKKQLLALSQTAHDNVDRFIASVGTWADQSLTMMGEVYKKKVQQISFGIGLFIAVAFNLDTLGVANHLYRDKAAREAIALVASDFVQKTSKETLDRCTKLKPGELRQDAGCAPVASLVEGVQRRNETLGQLPLGWPPAKVSDHLPLWLTLPVGWLLTALAISLGAAFWFDLLNKVVNVRHGMRRPSPEDTGAGSKP